MLSNPAAPARPAAHERPSPFTIPEPTFKFAEGPPSETPPARPMTVEGLIKNLTAFADFYEGASADIERASAVEKAHHRSGRDANADGYQRCFRATPGIDRVRAYVLARYGEELTIGTARRVLGDLIRVHKLSVEAAGALSLEVAMDRLDGDGGTERSEGKPIPLRPDHLTQRGETPTLPATVRNWLTARYLADPTPGEWQLPNNVEPEPLVFVRYEDFAEYLLNAGFDLLPNLEAWKNAGWIGDTYVDLTPTDNPTDSPPHCLSRLNLPAGRHRLVAIRRSVLNAPTGPDRSNSEESGATAELPTGKVPGVVSLNVLRSTLEMMGHPDWRKRFESWPEVPYLRLRCAELFLGQPFSSATIELLIAWFQERGLSPEQARHLPLSEAVRRLSRSPTAGAGGGGATEPSESASSPLVLPPPPLPDADRTQSHPRLAALRSGLLVVLDTIGESQGGGAHPDVWRAKLNCFWDEARALSLQARNTPPAPPVKVVTIEDVRGAIQLLLDWVNGELAGPTAFNIRDRPLVHAGGPDPDDSQAQPKPFFPLKGWPAIISALNERLEEDKHPDNESTRELIRRANTEHAGPIILPSGRGKHPQVDKFELLKWWSGLREHYVNRVEEAEQEAESVKQTVAEAHPYSRSETVVPGIVGRIKKRKKAE